MTNPNNFGLMSADYDLARRGYPDEVFEYLKSFVKKTRPETLDIGCGTGISTRQLKENGFEVIGADKDSAMVEVAKQRSPEISYFVAPANQLPFEAEHFDIATAFTAFHWFNDEESLTEIKRILKVGGIFSAALKVSGNSDDRRSAIYKKYAGDNFDSTRNHFNKEFLIKSGFSDIEEKFFYVDEKYKRFINCIFFINIKEFLIKSGFSDIEEKFFYVDEKYTIDEALILNKTLSLWNLVPENKKPEMLKELRALYETDFADGVVIIHRKISTVVAFKK